MKKRIVQLVALIAVCLFVCGCSFSKSSSASSKSSSSPSRSSSKASAPAKEKSTITGYKDEVVSLTILYVGSRGSSLDFQRELGEISSRHSIADWEKNAETFRAIGLGLKRSKVPESSFQSLPFLQDLNTSPIYKEIMQGYR